MNKFTSDHTLDVVKLISPIDQPLLNVAKEWKKSEKSEHWLMRISEAGYKGWRRSGSQSYGL